MAGGCAARFWSIPRATMQRDVGDEPLLLARCRADLGIAPAAPPGARAAIGGGCAG